MLDLRKAFLAVLVIPALIPPCVPRQSRASTSVPDQFEFIEGHAYMGSDSVKWKDGRLVFVKRVADMSGKGSFNEKVETLKPAPEAWERFWKRIDALSVWEWKPDYHDPKRDGPDGNSWALTLQHGAKQVKSKGYNAVPDAYIKFREAVYELMEDARRHGRE